MILRYASLREVEFQAKTLLSIKRRAFLKKERFFSNVVALFFTKLAKTQLQTISHLALCLPLSLWKD